MRTHRWYLLASTTAVMLYLPHSWAQGFDTSLGGNFYVSPSLFYYSGLRSRTSREEKTYLAYDFKLGYQVSPSFYLGLSYQGEQNSVKNSGYASAALNNSAESQRESYGVSFGYITNTIHFLFTYYLDSKWKSDTTTSTGTGKFEYFGNGMQLDVGYKIPLWSFFFGPQVSYKVYTYSKLSTDGGPQSTASPKLEESNLEPSLVFYYFF